MTSKSSFQKLLSSSFFGHLKDNSISHSEILVDLFEYVRIRAYDRAAIKFRGLHADINFIVDDYNQDIAKVFFSYNYFCFKYYT